MAEADTPLARSADAGRAQTPADAGRIQTPAADTRTRLILAAMELFGERGVEGASLRSINELADCRNSGAVHYHFGGRVQLVSAILDFIVAQWGEPVPPERLASVSEILRAMALSQLELRDSHPWGLKALRFLERLMMDQDPEIQALWRVHFEARLQKVADRLAMLCPAVPPTRLRLRFMMAVVTLVHGVSGLNALQRTALGDVRGGRSDLAMIDELAAFATGGLLADVADPA